MRRGPGQPPSGAARLPVAQELLEQCVHCGFCLPACPTYGLWAEEMDSPRGRIDLMRAVQRGELALGATLRAHIDACLGCMACMTACPSGVRYDQLLGAARSELERQVPRTLADRAWRAALLGLFPHPARVRAGALLGWIWQAGGGATRLRRSRIYPRLPARARALLELTPEIGPGAILHRLPRHAGATVPGAMRVGLLSGCVAQVFFAHVHEATIRVLAAEGCEVVIPSHQGCCGALAEHSGDLEAARSQARSTVERWEASDVDVVVVNAAGCGSALKHYGHLLGDDPRYAARAAALAAKVRDVTELVDGLGPRARRHPVHARVAYHDACHLAHAQGITEAPRRLLASVPGLEVVELGDQGVCCGSAGIYNLLQPEAADELGRRKARSVRAAQVDLVATANPGCLLQLRRHLGAGIPLVHPIEVLDASLRGVDPRDPPGSRRHGLSAPTLRRRRRSAGDDRTVGG